MKSIKEEYESNFDGYRKVKEKGKKCKKSTR